MGRIARRPPPSVEVWVICAHVGLESAEIRHEGLHLYPEDAHALASEPVVDVRATSIRAPGRLNPSTGSVEVAWSISVVALIVEEAAALFDNAYARMREEIDAGPIPAGTHPAAPARRVVDAERARNEGALEDFRARFLADLASPW